MTRYEIETLTLKKKTIIMKTHWGWMMRVNRSLYLGTEKKTSHNLNRWWSSLLRGLFKTRQIWGIWKLRLAYSPEMPNLGKNRWCFVPCDLEIWWMTLENKRASLLCCFKLCATFHSHWWIQTGVTVRKRPIWVKIDDFLSRVTLQFDVWWP